MASIEKKIGKNAFINYLQASFQELRKVTWPTRNRAVRLTFLVLGFCLVVAIFLGIMDYAFNTGYFQLISLGPERTVTTIDQGTQAPITSAPITIGEDGAYEVDLGDETAAGSPISVTPLPLDGTSGDVAVEAEPITAEIVDTKAVLEDTAVTTQTPAETVEAPAAADETAAADTETN